MATASATSAGLTEKLDYLQDLGVTAIWLLPFYPSPLKDDGYDIADYTDVNPSYGTLQDFRTLPARGAPARPARHHRAGAESHVGPAPLVPAGPPRPAGLAGARLLRLERHGRTGTPTRGSSSRTSSPRTGPGIPIASAYYWHRFYSHQPDLNFDNPTVHEATLRGARFLARHGRGRAAARRGAVPLRARGDQLREPARDARLPAGAARARSTRSIPDRMLLAEANQWPEDAVAYFGDGDECHMAFHFPVMPRLFMALQMEDRFPIIDILEQTPADSREVPVGHLPPQSRRADARDGDRRGAGLHVPGLRQRSAGAHQPRHPPPARAAAGQQPPARSS